MPIPVTEASGRRLRRQTRRKEARPRELIDAALDVFVAAGYAAARLEDIARRADVTKGTVYRYFRNKQELFEAVVRDTLGALMHRGQTALREFEGPTVELLDRVVTDWWDGVVLGKASALPKLMIAESGNFPKLARVYYEQVIEPARWLQRRILERGIARGEFRAVDVDSFLHFIIGPLLYVQCWRHSFASVMGQPELADRRFLAALLDHLHGALGVPREPEPVA